MRLAQSLEHPSPLPQWAFWLLVGTTCGALLLGWSQSRKLSRIQEQLALQTSQTQAQVVEAHAAATQARDLARDAMTRVQLGDARLNEYTLQRSNLEQLAFDISRNWANNQLVEMELSLRLAQQQAQLTGLAEPLMAALRTASQRLERSDQPRLLSLQMAIDSDLVRLSSAAVTDTAGLLVRIDKLLEQINSLPLRNAVGNELHDLPQPRHVHATLEATPAPSVISGNLPTPAMPSSKAAAPASQPPAAAHETAASLTPLEPVEIATEASVAGVSGVSGTAVVAELAEKTPTAAPVQDRWRDWPGRLWRGVRDEARQLFRVRHIQHPDAILLTPDQAFFLRENLRLQLMNARMALLARQNESARSDLALVQTALQQYFDLEAANTRHALQILQQLQEHIQAVELPAITETLAAIAAASASNQAALQATMPPPPPTPAATLVGTPAASGSVPAATLLPVPPPQP